MSNAPWVRIDKVGGHAGEIVEIRGWLGRLRSSGKLSFLQLRDDVPGLGLTLKTEYLDQFHIIE